MSPNPQNAAVTLMKSNKTRLLSESAGLCSPIHRKRGLFLAAANHQKRESAKRITCKTASTTLLHIDKRRSSFDR